MKLLFVMDPFENLDLQGDTTLAFMDEACRRSHEIFTCRGIDLGLEQAGAVARARKAEVHLASRIARGHGDVITLPLEECDAVFLRQDPPFDTDYLHSTLICEATRGRTLFVNDPRGLREANEKLFAMRLPDLMPPTIVTRDRARIREFLREQGGAIVLKPIDGRGGEGVFLAREGDLNLNALLEISTNLGRRPVCAQRYLPESRLGDKRILVLDGEPIGAVLRVPREDDARANLHIGGRAMRTELSSRDRLICERLAPLLKEWGLHFTGIDVIGQWLTEVNVTSPTGLRQIDELQGSVLAKRVLDWVERRVG